MEQEVYLSVIIPAFNEEKRLPKTLSDIDSYLSKQGYSYEIIVVSDGSTDRTVEVVKNLMPKIKNLKVIEFKENKGKGFGVKEGMLKAKGKYRIFTDADNSTSIDQIEKMFHWFESGYDIVIGSRDIKGAVLDPPQKAFRRLTGEIFKYLRKIIVGLWDIEDSQCGFKGFREKSVRVIFPKSKIVHFGFDPEILVIGKKMGYKIKEIPIYWKNDPKSKVKFKSMVKMGIDLLKIRLNLLKRIYGS
jgi:dolichyl-phosphate beta-glucosyltransferase